MTFKNQLVIFLVVSVVWTLIEHLHVPGWAVGLIALPITLVGGVALLMLSSERAARNPQPIPKTAAYQQRVRRLGKLAGTYEAMGFEFADEFLLASFPEVVVFLLRHRSEPITVALYDLGKKTITDVGTPFADDWELDTSTQTEQSGHRRPRALLQHFGAATPEELVARHRDAIAFLREQGLEPALDRDQHPREEFLASLQRSYREMRSRRFGIVRMIWGQLTNAGARMALPIREQYPEGLPGSAPRSARVAAETSTVLGARADALATGRPAPRSAPPKPPAPRVRSRWTSVQKQLAITLVTLAASGGFLGWTTLRERRDLAALRSGTSADRRTALGRLRYARIEPEKILPALAAAVSDPDAELRGDVLTEWVERAPGSAEVHAALGRALGDPDPRVRARAARRIADLDEADADDGLRDVVLARAADADAGVRATALSALRAWAPRDRRADEALIAALADDDAAVRLKAARLLSSPRLAAIDASAAFAARLGDPDPRVRPLVREALASAGAQANGDSVVALVARRLTDPDPAVRRAAIATLDLVAERVEAASPTLATALREIDARYRHTDAELGELLRRIGDGSEPLTRVESFARLGRREVEYTTPTGWMVAVQPLGELWLARVESPDGRVTGRATLVARGSEIASYDPSFDVALARYGIVHQFVLKLDAVPAFATPLVHESAADAEIQAFEARYGVALPEHVRAFLRRTNGFGPKLAATLDTKVHRFRDERAGIWPIASWRHPSEVTEQRWLRKLLTKLAVWTAPDAKRSDAESWTASLEKSFVIGGGDRFGPVDVLLRPPHVADNDDWDLMLAPLGGELHGARNEKFATLDAVASSLASARFEGRYVGIGGVSAGEDAPVDGEAERDWEDSDDA
ncbi:MAG: HEAT repeat domain-containing protein [bacterium]